MPIPWLKVAFGEINGPGRFKGTQMGQTDHLASLRVNLSGGHEWGEGKMQPCKHSSSCCSEGRKKTTKGPQTVCMEDLKLCQNNTMLESWRLWCQENKLFWIEMVWRSGEAGATGSASWSQTFWAILWKEWGALSPLMSVLERQPYRMTSSRGFLGIRW